MTPALPPFVDVETWRAHRAEWVTADVRFYLDGRDARAGYDAGHLAGAVYVDLARWLSGPPSAADGRHPLPDPAVFAEGLGSLGIGDDDTVVACDDAGGVIAARLVWMLRATGHRAALLDGGIGAPGEPLVTEPGERAPARFSARPWPAALLADLDDLAGPGAAAPHDPAAAPPEPPTAASALPAAAHTVLLDARPADRFAGAPDGVDPRPGHVPGARSLPCRANVAEGYVLPPQELRARFAAVGAGPGTDVISMCGSGVTACHTLLALEHAGLPAGRLYPGSWSQYSHTDRPVGTGT